MDRGQKRRLGAAQHHPPARRRLAADHARQRRYRVDRDPFHDPGIDSLHAALPRPAPALSADLWWLQ